MTGSSSFTRTILVSMLLIIPICIVIQTEALAVASASSSCSIPDGDQAEFDKHLRNVSVALEDYEDGWWEEEDDDDRKRKGRQFSTDQIVSDNIPLLPLEDGFHTSFTVENGSGGGVRMNLSTGMRYTFCLVVDDLDSNGTAEPNIDAYLFLSHDYDSYSNHFWMLGGEVRPWMDDFEENVPPEWRGNLWRSYRDSHAMENTRDAEFSVLIDKQEVYSSMFTGEVTFEEFVLVIDAVDNSRLTDAPAPHATMAVDLTVMAEEAFILPTWTVPLACMSLMFMLVAIPVVMHVKHSRAGLSVDIAADLVPTMDKEGEGAEKTSTDSRDASDLNVDSSDEQ